MDYINNLNLGSTAELAIISAVIYMMISAIKKTKIDNKWLPWISMIIGTIAGLLAVVTTGDVNYLQGSVLGLLVGGFTSGLFDGFKGGVK